MKSNEVFVCQFNWQSTIPLRIRKLNHWKLNKAFDTDATSDMQELANPRNIHFLLLQISSAVFLGIILERKSSCISWTTVSEFFQTVVENGQTLSDQKSHGTMTIKSLFDQYFVHNPLTLLYGIHKCRLKGIQTLI